jgi:starch synthase (maltosyl-transferring)
MFPQGEATAPREDRSEIFAPKIYYFHPLQAGPRDAWPRYFGRCRQMGFTGVLAAPVFAPGARGDIFLAGDHEHANPLLGGRIEADALIARLAQGCAEHGLDLLLDVVIGRLAPEADLARSNPGWFQIAGSDGARIDPRATLGEPQAAYTRFADPIVAKAAANWWIDRLRRLAQAGVSGFRCLAPQLVPPGIWHRIVAGVREQFDRCHFLAWTPGLDWHVLADLEGVGFAAAFSSLPWWDGRAAWLIEEHELLRRIGSVISVPEAPFGPRLARRFDDSASLPARYRHMLRCAASTGDGLLVPMGFEYACSEEMQSKPAANDGFPALPGAGNIELTAEICEANALSGRLAQCGLGGETRILGSSQRSIALLRCDAEDVRGANEAAVVLINSDFQRDREVPISLSPLPPTAGADFIIDRAPSPDNDMKSQLHAGEVRVLHAKRSGVVAARSAAFTAASLSDASRIAIENITPGVDGGQFAAKRLIGEYVDVEADVFTDGHDVLVVDLLWRAIDEQDWHREGMSALGNDRWHATIRPRRIGRYKFTIEAWIDKYGTLCRDLEIKTAAHSDIAVEIVEGRQLLERASRAAEGDHGTVIHSALTWLNDTSGDSDAAILLAAPLREVMREAEEHSFRVRHQPALTLDIERPQAGFAAWYELFPRSATDSVERHGTLRDVIAKLPMIRDMGFDVLYLLPIHPIGTTNRKGKNNALTAAPGDVGSAYAIGGPEGGHDSIHPALGTLADFQALRDEASAHGLEIALDFAIQCSPDHPWLNQHPEWFNWRPDGSIRYAENPPKKYEDIVNVDFYAQRALPDLWLALRDVVLFWIDQGVRIFRVDNPHTKPLPFWEWMLGEVRAQHPDVIFLSEAFTRPKMMYRLAKIGFSQSYTYFTWRNSKRELTDYFVELTTSPVKEFFRPHLFVNTPDINPYFLQTSGRPGFLIRAALAATLSGLWGIYSGFELCESAPLPGREEYLDSEKYQIRVRHPDAPGNIVAEIAKLNRIRKSHPALQSHLGLRFYPAHNDQVLLYGKPLPAQDDIILIAVSLDPFLVQEVTVEVPLWEWGLPDHGSLIVHDLMRDSEFVWYGKLQRIRLDPFDLPFAIWRVAPRTGG